MSLLPTLIPKDIENKSHLIEKEISYNYNPFFNSKLFLYLDNGNQEEEVELNNQTDSDTSNDNEYEKYEIDEMYFLTHELINELNNCNIYSENKIENKIDDDIINSLISLAKNGYEFKPKNYSKTKNNKEHKKNYHYNNLNYEYKSSYYNFKNNKKYSYRSFNYINNKANVVY